MSELPAWDGPAMHLRLLKADDVVDDVAETEQMRLLTSPALTLWQYGEHCLIPDKLQGKRDPATIQRLRDALNWWRRLTGDPALAIISDRDVTHFEQHLGQQKGRRGPTLSPETVRQTLVRVRYVMRQAAKTHVVRGRRLRFLETVPEFELPKRCKPKPNPYTVEEANRIIAACDSEKTTWPTLPGVTAPAYWRTLWSFIFYEGNRRTEALKLDYASIDGDVLTVPDEIAKHGHGGTQRLHPETLALLQSIRTPRRYIFELPLGNREWKHAVEKLMREATKILKRAKAYQPGRVFHGMRKTNASELERVEGREAAQKNLRHTDARTTEAYVSQEASRDFAYQAKLKLPRLPRDDGRQLRLNFGD